jgi:hypothetical protein
MLRKAMLATPICVLGIACTTVRPVKPVDYIPKHGPDLVWVIGADSAVVPVVLPHVADDTLVGTRRGTSDTVRLALTDVRSVTAKVPDHKKTAFLVIGLTSLGTVVLYEFAISKEGDQTAGVNCGVYQSTREGGNPGDPKPDC